MLLFSQFVSRQLFLQKKIVSFQAAVFLIFICAFTSLSPDSAQAYTAHLSWQPSSSANVLGYYLKVGSDSGSYDLTIDVGLTLSYDLAELVTNQNYYATVVAYNSNSKCSSPSNEILLFLAKPIDDTSPHLPSPPPLVDNTNPSGSSEPSLDSDGDGLEDNDEATLGTCPNTSDTDGDQIGDAQEVSDGTNPLDGGSSIKPLGTTLCAEWNGFLGGMYNILEHVNLSNRKLRVTSTLYDIDGRPAGQSRFSIAPQSQFDLLVHDLPGWTLNKVGRICSKHDGLPGDLDGRMSYYKKETDTLSTKEFEFAFSMPLLNGQKGRQYLAFNTYQPSLNIQDADNPVANWIQLSSDSSSLQKGTLNFYNSKGTLIKSEKLSLKPRARFDYPAHNLGLSLIGLVEWVPANHQAEFQLRNVRYLYDNPGTRDSFATAYQLSAAKGTGETITLPLATINQSAVLEISNTLPTPVKTTIEINSKDGKLLKRQSLALPAFASYHLVADSILVNAQGIARISTNQPNSLLSTAMHYVRDSRGSICYMFGVQAKAAAAGLLKGSYNTYLEQKSTLVITNRTNTPQRASIALTRAGGKKIELNSERSNLMVPAKGTLSLNINGLEKDNQYGSISVIPQSPSALSSWVLREKLGNYVMTTEMRNSRL